MLVGVRYAVACFWLCGCNSIFGLAATQPYPDGLLIDAKFFDAPLDSACTTATIEAEADGPLNSTLPTQGNSQQTLVNLSNGLMQRGLVRFDTSGFPATPPAPLYSLTLVVAYAVHDDACGAGCGPCLGLEAAGNFRVYPARSDWTERNGADVGITWNCRMGASGCTALQQWQVPGAEGLSDRGSELGALDHVAGQDSSLEIKGVALTQTTSWLDVKKLSFEIVPNGSAQFVIRAHEHTCDAGAHASQLTATYCP
jgi:hypothetical protein